MTDDRRDAAASERGDVARMLAYIFAGVCFIVGSVLVVQGLTGDTPRGDVGASAAQARQAGDDAATVWLVDGTPVTSQAIEQIQVGRRVMGRNPELSDADRAAAGPEPHPDSWRLLRLRMTKADGDRLDMTLLRPVEWIDRYQAAAGGVVYLDMQEMGAVGEAQVLAVEACPAIQPGPGRVVTGTFAHQSGDVIDLKVSGMVDPLGTTANHPFWSEDRQAFVPAGQLQSGENLRLFGGGLAQVESIIPRGPPEPVYNLEVHGEHVYHVGVRGVLVHNNCPIGRRFGLTFLDDRSVEFRGRTVDVHEDISHLSDDYLRRMFKDGVAPRDTEGIQINLHHVLQDARGHL